MSRTITERTPGTNDLDRLAIAFARAASALVPSDEAALSVTFESPRNPDDVPARVGAGDRAGTALSRREDRSQ